MPTLTWADMLADPCLQDLPFKMELNRWGKIEMTPRTNAQGMARATIAMELDQRSGGRVTMGCSIATSDGVRVADVAWISDDRLRAFGDVTPYPSAPDICVEVMSPFCCMAEMEMKAGLYLQAGADEVWIARLDGQRRVIRP